MKLEPTAAISRHFCVHGLPLELNGALDLLDAEVDDLLGAFEAERCTDGPAPAIGTLRRYDQREVMKHLSPKAVRVATPGQIAESCIELYQEGDRFWLVDDRWGMAEINLLKGTWRSWVLPRPTLDPLRCAEMAILWPMAQILRGRGLYFLPAASASRDGWGVLLLSPVGLDAELSALARGGFQIIGRRWSCLREQDGKVVMLHVPGQLEPASRTRLLTDDNDTTAMLDFGDSVDSDDFVGWSQSASCDAVICVEPSRRPLSHAKELPPQLALDSLRRSWPMIELHRARRQMALKLATACRCCDVQLSRRPEDLLVLLGSLRDPTEVIPRTAPMIAPRETHTEAPTGARRFVLSSVRA